MAKFQIIVLSPIVEGEDMEEAAQEIMENFDFHLQLIEIEDQDEEDSDE